MGTRTRRTGGALRAFQVKVVAILSARSGRAGELRSLLERMVDASRTEPGNLRYDLWQDELVPDRFVLDELYVDADAVARHRATPHFRDYLERIDGLAERTALVFAPVAVATI